MSQPVTFQPGVQYLLHKQGYQVVQILSDGMLIARTLETNAHICHRLTELWQHWLDNTLEFAREGPNLYEQAETPLKTAYTFANLVDLPTPLQEIAWHRYHLIRPLLHLSSAHRTKQVIEAQIRKYLSSLEHEQTPGTPTFLASLSVQRILATASPSLLSPPQEPDEERPDNLPIAFERRPEESFFQEHDPLLSETTPSSHCSPHDKRTSPEERPSEEQPLPLTTRTVSRWLRRYWESHEDIRSLVPSYYRRGPHQSHLSPLLEDLLQQAIKQTYLTAVRAPVTHVITCFHALILAENKRRTPEEQLLPPANVTVYRYIQRLDPKEVDLARKGPAATAHEHHQSLLGPLPTRPNQRAELDFARLDLLVVDPVDRIPIGRPTIAAIRDKYTGYPLGVFISFDPPSYRVAMECMLYAFLPKQHVKEQFHTKNEYLAFGIPEVLVVDNAMELDRDLELACLQLGIELQHMPVRKPWFKGSIERWFRTLNTDLIHVTPGTTFSHFLERGDYHSEHHACITLDRLWELLHLWIVDVYTQEVRSGVGGHPRGKGIPAILWQQALEGQFVPRLPPSRNDLLVLISRTTKRILHHYGIEFEQLLYQDHQLTALRNKFNQAKKYRTAHNDIAHEDDIKAKRIQIKYHPGDLSRIWVLDPFSNQYLEVEAMDKDYTKNLSLWKHRVIKRYAQEELKRQVNPQALLAAKARLQQFITEEMRLTQKLRSRQGMMRWWNTQVTTWISASTQITPTSSSPEPREISREDEPEMMLEQAPMETTHAHDKPLPSSLLISTPSIADLSTPFVTLDESAILLHDHAPEKHQALFEQFPPLPVKERSPLTNKRTSRHSTAKKSTVASGAAPQETHLPEHLTREQDIPANAEQQEQNIVGSSEEQQTNTNELLAPYSSEMTSTIDERKQSFSIEIRSARWR
jgi:putative transposase